MTNRRFPGEQKDGYSSSASVMDLCRAIFEDTEDARQYRYQGRGALDLHNVLPPGPAAISHGSHPLPSELTNLIA
jgi:hypothetical protein